MQLSGPLLWRPTSSPKERSAQAASIRAAAREATRRPGTGLPTSHSFRCFDGEWNTGGHGGGIGARTVVSMQHIGRST